ASVAAAQSTDPGGDRIDRPEGNGRRAASMTPALIQPLARDRYHVHFTAGVSLRDKLQRAQDLLRHAIPTGDPAEVIERALDALIETVSKEKYAATDSPPAHRGGRKGSGPAPGSRHVPAEVRRAVLARDGERCAYIAPDGRRCHERAFLEFHHVKP